MDSTNQMISALKQMEELMETDYGQDEWPVDKYIKTLNSIIVAGVYNQVKGIQILTPQAMDFLMRVLNKYARFEVNEATRLNEYLPLIYKVVSYVNIINTEDAQCILKVLKVM